MYAIKWQNQFESARIDIGSRGSPRVDIDGRWRRLKLMTICFGGRKENPFMPSATTHMRLMLLGNLPTLKQHWKQREKTLKTENRVKYVCKAVKCNCPGSANWAPSRGQLFCNVHINMATASSDVRKGRLAVGGNGAWHSPAKRVRHKQLVSKCAAASDTRRGDQRVCLASHRLHRSQWFGMGCLTASLSPCHPVTLPWVRGGSTRTRRSQSTWPQRNSWQHPRACGNWSTFTLSQTTTSNAIRAHRLWSSCHIPCTVQSD